MAALETTQLLAELDGGPVVRGADEDEVHG